MRAPAESSRAARPAPGSCVVSRTVAVAGELGELPVEQLGALGVERGERLVEDEQLRLVQERAAEREPLRHPARVRRDALGADVPEAVALEQHPDPLAPLRHAVEPAVEVEVLDRGQVAVEQRLVAEVAERAAVGVDLELAAASARRARRRGAAASSCRTRSRPVTTRKPPRSSRKSSGRSARRAPVALLDRPRARSQEHVGEDEAEEDDADDAVDGEERGVEAAQVAGPDERVLVREQRRDGDHAEPVEQPDVEARGRPAASNATVPTWKSRAPRRRRRARRSASPTSAGPARDRARGRRASRRGRSRRPRARPRRRAPTPARAARR